MELAVDLLYDESIVRDWYRAKTDKKDPKFSERLLPNTSSGICIVFFFFGGLPPTFFQPRQILPPMVHVSVLHKAV